MIGYVCKYTPVELLSALDASPVLIEPKVANFNGADACLHPNVCSYAKAVYEAFSSRAYEGLVLTSCCDSVRRLADALKEQFPERFIYVLDLPRKNDEASQTLFAQGVLALAQAYGAFSGHEFRRECLVDLLESQRLEARSQLAKDAAGAPGTPRVGIVGARYSADIARMLEDRGLEVSFDLSCAHQQRAIGKGMPAGVLDALDDEQLVRAYAGALLAQLPCVRMANVSERDAFLDESLRELDGLVYHTVKFCDIYSFEYAYLRQRSPIPLLKIETDATRQSSEQIRTRVEAFAESLKGEGAPVEEASTTRHERSGAVYVLGIDSGSTSTNAVVLNGARELLASSVVRTGARASESARKAAQEALDRAGVAQEDLALTVATGYGRSSVSFADRAVTEISCHGKGAWFFNPQVRTILDIGGQDSKAIRLDAHGEVAEFVMNDKCAAGTGRFLEAMARTLECDISELGELSADSKNEVEISSTCTVFAESEVIGLIANDVERADIAHGVHAAIAGKAFGLLRRVGLEPAYMMTGGVARNPGVVRAVEELLGAELFICNEPDIVGAVGAAVIGLESIPG